MGPVALRTAAAFLLAAAMSVAPIRAFAAEAEATTPDFSEIGTDVLGSSGELVEGQLDTATRVVSELDRSFRFEGLNHDITVVGSIKSDSELEDLLGELKDTISAFEGEGRTIAVYIQCVDTEVTLTYNVDELMYPASSIKGPYTISVYQTRDEGNLKCDATTLARLAKPTIIASDNDTYRTMRATYGTDVFVDWCVEHGVIADEEKSRERMASDNYPFITCRELAHMWLAADGWLTGESKSAAQLRKLFVQRLESPLREGVSPKAPTLAKAGWFPYETAKKFCATNDAGLVTQGKHHYVVAVMTDAPADLDKLASIMPGIWTARKALW